MCEQIKRSILIVTKIILGIFILICFGASLVICDEDILVCRESLKALKDDLQDWQERCLDNTLEYSRDIDTPCCNAEKGYLQSRRKMQRKLCFYQGDHVRYSLQCIPEMFHLLFQMGGRIRAVIFETTVNVAKNN